MRNYNKNCIARQLRDEEVLFNLVLLVLVRLNFTLRGEKQFFKLNITLFLLLQI